MTGTGIDRLVERHGPLSAGNVASHDTVAKVAEGVLKVSNVVPYLQVKTGKVPLSKTEARERTIG